MSQQSNSEDPKSLEVTGTPRVSVPTFACLINVQKNEDGTVTGRVANLAEIESSGSSERDVLMKVTREFKSRISKLLEEGQEIPWIDPPQAPLENEKRRSVPMHL